jgi:hypothetical protein
MLGTALWALATAAPHGAKQVVRVSRALADEGVTWFEIEKHPHRGEQFGRRRSGDVRGENARAGPRPSTARAVRRVLLPCRGCAQTWRAAWHEYARGSARHGGRDVWLPPRPVLRTCLVRLDRGVGGVRLSV